MNPINFRDVNPFPPWETEQWVMEQELRVEASTQGSVGLFDDYPPLVANVIRVRRKNGNKEGS